MNGKSIVLRELGETIGEVQKVDAPDCPAFKSMSELTIRTARIAESCYIMNKRIYYLFALVLLAVLPASGVSVTKIITAILNAL